jgi:hypothetical protein
MQIIACLVFSNTVYAAYVQWQFCHGQPGSYIPELLRGKIEHHDGKSIATLHLASYMKMDACQATLGDGFGVDVEVAMFGRSITNHTTPKRSCSDRAKNSTTSKVSLSELDIFQDLGSLHPLSTLYTEIRMRMNDSGDIGCVFANITPQIDASTSAALRYLPLAIFLFVLIVSVVRSMCGFTDMPFDEEGPITGTSRTLPAVGECLQYLQFVFLSGSLALRYPGFYQPAVSNLNWFSLFSANGPVTHGMTYPSIKDGIYEINGTYGGTYGLELMTQIVGAPMTMDLWLNMVILLVTIAVLSAILTAILAYLKYTRSSQRGHGQRQPLDLRRTILQVLKIIFSYFLLPLVSLSAYQIDHVSILPAYHIALAVILILAAAIAFFWLFKQMPTRNLGSLVFDSTKKYRRLSNNTSYRLDRSYIIAIFTLVFIRGTVIGALQISGTAQLVVLIVCEIVFLLCITVFQPHTPHAGVIICSVARLGSLICMTTFLPDFSPIQIKSLVGYILLILHTVVLILVFLVRAMYQLVQACSSRLRTEKPQVRIILPCYSDTNVNTL